MLDHFGASEIADREAIREQLAVYCRAIDRRDFELLRAVYHHDATDEHAGLFTGSIDEFVEFARELLQSHLITTHAIQQVLIRLAEDAGAISEAYYQATHIVPDGADGYRLMMVGGRYQDYWTKRDGRWLIRHRKTEVDWMHSAPLADDSVIQAHLNGLSSDQGADRFIDRGYPFGSGNR